MKGNKKILVLAGLLLLITVSFATYAIYRESTSVQGNLTTANWSVTVNNTSFETANLTFTLSNLTCGDSNPGKAGTIAPGAECYIDYNIDADGSEVDVVVEAEIDTVHSTNIPTNMDVNIGTTSGVKGPVNIPYSATEGEMEKTVRLNVVWPGDLDDFSADEADLADKAKQTTIAVKLTARQALSNN